MFIVVNVILVVVAFTLIMGMAATSSNSSRHAAGPDSPESEWTVSGDLPVAPNQRQPASGRVDLPYQASTTGGS